MILTQEIAEKKLHRMALEIAERNHDKNQLVLIGIKENGVFIANKIAALLKSLFTGEIILLELWIDKKNPGEVKLNKSIDFTGKTILMIDDVANSGRTLLYALKPLLQQFPTQIQTLALVERTHKFFPVAIDYVGLSVSTTLQQNIIVKVENGEIKGAYIK